MNPQLTEQPSTLILTPLATIRGELNREQLTEAGMTEEDALGRSPADDQLIAVHESGQPEMSMPAGDAIGTVAALDQDLGSHRDLLHQDPPHQRTTLASHAEKLATSKTTPSAHGSAKRDSLPQQAARDPAFTRRG